MKKLSSSQMESLNGGLKNCDGIYYSCVGAAGFAGAAAVMATAGWGIAFAVVASGAAMEYCRQQAIGCD